MKDNRRPKPERERGGEPKGVGELLNELDPLARLRRKLDRGELPMAREGDSPKQSPRVPAIAKETPRATPPSPLAPRASLRIEAPPREEAPVVPPQENQLEVSGRYDFDLAEFPLFRFEKPKAVRLITPGEALVYEDTIRGKDGDRVTRTWKALPGNYGWGGGTTQDLLFDLLQLYIAQGCQGQHIEFGSLRSLFVRRYGTGRNPSAKDFARLRRDLEILRGYSFQTKNAFWDTEQGCYVDMNWRLFDNVFYLKERPDEEVFQFAYVAVNEVLRSIARTRGFFALGFGSRLFYQLSPLEKRLAVYLAKRFLVEQVHRRKVDDICAALPIQAARADNRRARLRTIAASLVEKGVPILKGWRVEKSKSTGNWLATFERAKTPEQRSPFPKQAVERMSEEVLVQLERIYAALPEGAEKDERWWTRCVQRLGATAVDRALGQLSDAPGVREPGRLLSHIFKDLAKERGILLN